MRHRCSPHHHHRHRPVVSVYFRFWLFQNFYRDSDCFPRFSSNASTRPPWKLYKACNMLRAVCLPYAWQVTISFGLCYKLLSTLPTKQRHLADHTGRETLFLVRVCVCFNCYKYPSDKSFRDVMRSFFAFSYLAFYISLLSLSWSQLERRGWGISWGERRGEGEQQNPVHFPPKILVTFAYSIKDWGWVGACLFE